MVLFTLATTVKETRFWQHSPYVIAHGFRYPVASFWTGTLGAPGTGSDFSPLILNLLVNFIEYFEANSISGCEATEASWYYDGNTLYIHMDHDVEWSGALIQYGLGRGFTDSRVAYVGQTRFLPLIQGSPSIEKSEDIKEYQRLKLQSLDLSLSNHGGIIDDIKDQFVIGNRGILEYVPNSAVADGVVDQSKIVKQAVYYVENSENGRAEVRLSLQDTRKLEKKVPTRTLSVSNLPFLQDSNDGKLVPLIYGPVRSMPCIPLTSTETGTTSATYRAGELLTSISAIRVKVEDTWETRTASSTDLANGTFTIPNARAAVDQGPYECQIDGVGIPVAHAPDIIVDLYSRFLGQGFTTQFYDTTAWAAASASIPACGLVIKESTDIIDIIPMIQNGVYPGFRFDITIDGRRAIVLDDRERPIDWFVSSVEVLNIEDVSVEEDGEYLFGSVDVGYSKDQTEGQHRRVVNSTYEVYAKENYQWSNSLEIDSLLTTEEDAQSMAAAKALEYKDPPKTVEVQLMGDRFFGVQVYDIMQVDTAMGRDEYYTGSFSGREFHGILVAQVVSVATALSDLVTTAILRVLDRTPTVDSYSMLRKESSLAILTMESGKILVF